MSRLPLSPLNGLTRSLPEADLLKPATSFECWWTSTRRLQKSPPALVPISRFQNLAYERKAFSRVTLIRFTIAESSSLTEENMSLPRRCLSELSNVSRKPRTFTTAWPRLALDSVQSIWRWNHSSEHSIFSRIYACAHSMTTT